MEIKCLGERNFEVTFEDNVTYRCEITGFADFKLPSPTEEKIFGISYSTSPVRGSNSTSQIDLICVCTSKSASITMFPLIHNVIKFDETRKIEGVGARKGRKEGFGLLLPRSLRNLVSNKTHFLIGKNMEFFKQEFMNFGISVNASIIEDKEGKIYCGLKMKQRKLSDDATMIELLLPQAWLGLNGFVKDRKNQSDKHKEVISQNRAYLGN